MENKKEEPKEKKKRKKSMREIFEMKKKDKCKCRKKIK